MPQELRITPVLNGFIVQAGCQTLVYDNPDKIITDFAEWVRNPNQIEARFGKMMEVKGFRNAPPPPPPPQAMRDIQELERNTQAAEAIIRSATTVH